MTQPSNRNAFGHLLCDPAKLDLVGRQEEFRRATGFLLAGGCCRCDANDLQARDMRRLLAWIGQGFQSWTINGGHLHQALGLAPPQGSRDTVAACERRKAQDRALLRLVAAAGGQARAVRIAANAEACPPCCRAALLDLEAVGGPRSRDAFRRAKGRTRPR